MKRLTVTDDVYEDLVRIAWIRKQMGERIYTVDMLACMAIDSARWTPNNDLADEWPKREEWGRLNKEWDDGVGDKVLARHGDLRGVEVTPTQARTAQLKKELAQLKRATKETRR